MQWVPVLKCYCDGRRCSCWCEAVARHTTHRRCTLPAPCSIVVWWSEAVVVVNRGRWASHRQARSCSVNYFSPTPPPPAYSSGVLVERVIRVTVAASTAFKWVSERSNELAPSAKSTNRHNLLTPLLRLPPRADSIPSECRKILEFRLLCACRIISAFPSTTTVRPNLADKHLSSKWR